MSFPVRLGRDIPAGGSATVTAIMTALEAVTASAEPSPALPGSGSAGRAPKMITCDFVHATDGASAGRSRRNRRGLHDLPDDADVDTVSS